MNYCKYHPLEGATHSCRACNIFQCDKCVNEEKNKDGIRCFVCGAEVESLGAANTVEPFWRKLPEAFRYPLNGNSMSLIIGCSILSLIAILIPFFVIFSFVLGLFATGSMLKYSFNCLERTALGEMKAPDVMDAYQGGIKLLIGLLIIIVILTAVVIGALYLLGTGVGGMCLVIAVVSFPAILIRYAQTESFVEAMNPFAAIALIKAVGLSYGVLIAFLMIMMSSVGVLHELIGNVFPAGAYFFQMIASNYYSVVMFHIMGYMLFQYQGQLGYTARADDDHFERSDAERLAAKIEVYLKEGDYEQVVKLYWQSFKLFPNENSFLDKYFEFLCACKKPPLMIDYATDYLSFLIRKKRFDKITTVYKQILFVAPDFMPETPEVRLQVAQMLMRLGDVKLVIKLLNGLHKLFPDFKGLVDAYLLLADALESIPNMKEQAEKCRKWVEQQKRKDAEKQLNSERAAAELSAQASAQVAAVSVAPAKQTKRMTPATQQPSGIKLELVPIEKNE